jgi:hypothetical protein
MKLRRRQRETRFDIANDGSLEEGFSFWPLLSGQLRGFQASIILTYFSSGMPLLLFCLAPPLFVVALILLRKARPGFLPMLTIFPEDDQSR